MLPTNTVWRIIDPALDQIEKSVNPLRALACPWLLYNFAGAGAKITMLLALAGSFESLTQDRRNRRVRVSHLSRCMCPGLLSRFAKATSPPTSRPAAVAYWYVFALYRATTSSG